MLETLLPCAPELRATTPAPDHPPLLEQLATLRLENAALRAQNAVLQERIRELEARLGQDSANSSRPLSSDPPHVLPKQRAVPSGRKRGGQLGHRGTYRALRPAVLWRKGSFGSDSEVGSRFAERLLTVVVTPARTPAAMVRYSRTKQESTTATCRSACHRHAPGE